MVCAYYSPYEAILQSFFHWIDVKFCHCIFMPYDVLSPYHHCYFTYPAYLAGAIGRIPGRSVELFTTCLCNA